MKDCFHVPRKQTNSPVGHSEATESREVVHFQISQKPKLLSNHKVWAMCVIANQKGSQGSVEYPVLLTSTVHAVNDDLWALMPQGGSGQYTEEDSGEKYPILWVEIAGDALPPGGLAYEILQRVDAGLTAGWGPLRYT